MESRRVDMSRSRPTVPAMQMRDVLLALLGGSCLALTACSVTYGNKAVSSATVDEKLVPGRTVKADVYDALGQPSDVVTMETGTLWTYRYRKAKNDVLGNIPLFGINLIAGGKNGDVYTVLALFDRRGILASRKTDRRKLYTSNLASLKRTLDVMIEEGLSHQRVEAEMKRIGRPFDPDAAKEGQLLESSLD